MTMQQLIDSSLPVTILSWIKPISCSPRFKNGGQHECKFYDCQQPCHLILTVKPYYIKVEYDKKINVLVPKAHKLVFIQNTLPCMCMLALLWTVPGSQEHQ